MRIIAGQSKGQLIKSPKGDITRPALAMVREAIFSSLGDIQDFVFIDIFAGSGSLGLEALSRGAGFVNFVEGHPRVVSVLIENIERLGYKDKAHIYKRHMPHGLSSLKIKSPANVLFCDPPYDKNLLNPTLKSAITNNLIDGQTQIIVEHTQREVPNVESLELVKQKKFGQTYISYLKYHDK